MSKGVKTKVDEGQRALFVLVHSYLCEPIPTWIQSRPL